MDPIQAATVAIFAPAADGKTGSLCTGTLIRRDVALTAAHCIRKDGPNPVMIFGNDVRSPMALHRPIEGVAIHPKWQTHAGKGMDQGDIALVRFGGRLPEGYKAVSSVNSDKEIRTGEKVTLAGYGVSNGKNKTGSGRLRKTEVAIIKNRPSKSEMILDQSHGHGACHGDSGGPAFLKRGANVVLAGVTNRGYPTRAADDCAHQVVYTKVPAYKSWINKTEERLESQTKSDVPTLLSSRERRRRPRTGGAVRHRGRKSKVHLASRTSRNQKHKKLAKGRL